MNYMERNSKKYIRNYFDNKAKEPSLYNYFKYKSEGQNVPVYEMISICKSYYSDLSDAALFYNVVELKLKELALALKSEEYFKDYESWANNFGSNMIEAFYGADLYYLLHVTEECKQFLSMSRWNVWVSI